MISEQKRDNVFRSGATWLRVDFHLHTKADKEFRYEGDENSFVGEYVSELKAKDIRIGVITNHNKFDAGEFKALRKKARKEEIYLLPGVELSVNDGANGIHTIVIFNDEWLANGQDYINQFLNVAFEGKTPSQYEQENSRSSLDLITTLKKLEGYQKDFIVIFAHVEQSSGLWKELDGGRLQEIGQNDVFRRGCLGFQKVRTRDMRKKVKNWFSDWYPAEVEGSDCKDIESIGNSELCYLKLGAFSFDAVKFALVDKDSRVATNAVHHTHSRIQNLRFTGGTLGGKQIQFSPELNTLIGVRGSGKSSILEVIRYVLKIPFGENSDDKKYKENLAKYTMGSGGKVEMDVIDRHSKTYTISKVYGEDTNVEYNGKVLPGVSITDSILRKPIYFGQKELSGTGEGFEKDLVNKLLGSKRGEVLQKISAQKLRVIDAVRNLTIGLGLDELIKEQNDIKKDTDHQLKFYSDYKIEEKLQKRLDFDADLSHIEATIEAVDFLSKDVSTISINHEPTLSMNKDYVSKHNAKLFENMKRILKNNYFSLISHLKAWEAEEPAARQQLKNIQVQMEVIRKGMVDEFAEIERRLSEELKESGDTNITSEEFLALKTKRSKAVTRIDKLQKQKSEFIGHQEVLLKEVEVLNGLWHEEFQLIKSELGKIEKESSAIAIKSLYKGDKADFVDTMKEYCKGSGLRDATFQGIAHQYSDFASIYKDLDNAKKLFGSNPQLFTDRLIENLESALTYQVPNRFVIKYRGKDLQHHSLGQRASALILFVLSLKENDVIIIDQPEDDLDNQTIYEDVIKLIRDMKSEVQFIFATHNPNIPVLGDAELVHGCSFVDERVNVQSGSVDAQDTQKMIVDIMEGGKEAFNRRKEIYKIWRP